jgi:phosphoglycerate dehydrogenase-like enzyme
MIFRRIAVVDSLSLSPSYRGRVQEFSAAPVVFPEDDPASEYETLGRIGDADAILVSWRTPLTASVLTACPALRYIGVCATSMAGIDKAAAARRGIAMTNVEDYGDEATAEFIFLQLLTLVRGAGPHAWRDEPCELNGKTIGIVGLGAVGQKVARLALGFDMRPSYFSRTRKPDWEAIGLRYVPLDELLVGSEIVTLHTPRGLRILDASAFERMRPGVILVDTAVGDVLDAEAFRHWIAGHGNFAIFDYATGEEYYARFRDLPNVIFPRTIAGRTRESQDRLGEKALANLARVVASLS